MGNDNVQGPAVAVMAKKLDAKKVYVVGDDSDYGIGLFKTSTEALGSLLAGTDKITTGQKDFSAAISKILNSKADAVFLSGYYAEGAPFDQQLVAKGFKGAFIGPDGIKDDQFVKQAGSASANAYFTCPCIPGELIPDFADAYKKAFKAEPGTYSIEGYDTAIVLAARHRQGQHDPGEVARLRRDLQRSGLRQVVQVDRRGRAVRNAGVRLQGRQRQDRVRRCA